MCESEVKAAVQLTINGIAAQTSFQDKLYDTFILEMACCTGIESIQGKAATA